MSSKKDTSKVDAQVEANSKIEAIKNLILEKI